MFRKSPKPHFEKVHEFVFSDGDRGNSAQSGHVMVKADPEAGRRRSKQNKAIVLGVAETALEEVKNSYIETKNTHKEEKFVMAGAYYDETGVLHASVLNEDESFGEVESDGRLLKAIALHQRPENTYMTMGIATQRRVSWTLHRDMLIPRGLEIVERDIKIPDLANKYPDVPLI